MRINRKKVNQISGLIATLNKIEKDLALLKLNADGCLIYPEFIIFTCEFRFYQFGDFCELTSHKMKMKRTHQGKIFCDDAFGGHWPTMQTLWDDNCRYDGFRFVVEFARNAIKSGGLINMKPATHEVTTTMPDYLGYEVVNEL